MAQVAKHNNPCDAWLVVDGLVYDVSKWLNHHPGGAKTLLRFAGKDATDEMLAFHPEWVSEKKLPFFKIGVVSDPPKPTSLQREFRALHSKFESNGWFQPDLIYYAKKLVLYGILFLTSISLVLFTRSDACHLLGAWMMAIFWWQMAFVGHDAGHMSVTYSRDMDYKFGLVIANLLTGISVGWWKSTHNVHHAVPNTLNHDPDIAHLPVLAVSNKFFQSPFHSYHNFNLNFGFLARRVFVPYQHYLYYPIMAAARFNLYLQSLVHMVTTSDPFKTLELVSELLFFVWYISLLTRLNSGWMMFWYVLISHGLSGILEVQITLSHFSKPVIDERETTKPNDPSGSSQYGGDFYTRNVLASLDVTCSEWMDWAHGGLQFQTIHHMYPRLHRSKLRAARVHVIALCKKYNLPFEEVSFWDANRQVLATLRKSALESKEWNPMIGESFSAVG